MHTNFRLYLSYIVAMLLFAACRDDTDELLLPDLALSETEIEIGVLGRYYTVKVSDMGDGDSIASVLPSDEWVTVDNVYSGVLTLYVEPNETQRHRYTAVNIVSALGRKALLTVSQLSDAEDGSNALPIGSLEVKSRVGWGYDITQDYMDVKSATVQVFSYEGLLSYEKEYGVIVAQDRRNYLDYTIHTAYSIAEMAEHLMKEQTDGVSFFGLSKKVSKYKTVDDFEQSQHSYGFAKITKNVATRYIDVGKVEAIIHEGRTDIFTEEFADLYKAVLDNPTPENAENLVKKFGTHVVTYADLGGRLEYTVNFKATQVSRDEMERVMKYKNGKLKEQDEERRKSEFSAMTSTMTATVFGGSESTKLALQSSSVSDDTNQQIPTNALAEWANTVTYEQQENLAMSNCRLTPIWQLFVEVEARNAVLSYIIRMVDNMMLSADMRDMLGLSGYYRFAVESLAIDDFGTDADATLVKVAYVNKRPVLEICNEYVPEIRGDGRVSIVYPISKQSANIRRGIFLGDSQHAPCEVSFDEKGGCYVANIEGYQVGDVIDTLYYVDGALYTENMNTPIQEASEVKIENQYYIITTDSYSNVGYNDIYHPLVKIGPGYWSRMNASGAEKVSCLDRENNRYDVVSWDGVNYANPYFEFQYIDFCVATIDELNALTNYIGSNQKPLFKGQQTGYDATFDGCCRVEVYEDPDDPWGYLYAEVNYSLFDKDEKCYNIFKEGTQIQVLTLNLDYTYSIKEIDSKPYIPGVTNDKYFYYTYFPYRPFHNSTYKYPDLK